MRLSLSLIGLAALVACGDTEPKVEDTGVVDADGDGLTAQEEAQAGTDPQNPDSDGDTLSDGDEVAAGLNPLSADSDSDLVLDGDEVAAGSDGLNCLSVPDGHWPNCLARAQADGFAGEGWAEGDIMNNWQAVDQHGNSIDFHQFYGAVVVLDLSAGWCGPCNSAAPGMETTWQTYRDQGFVMLHLMIDDWSYDGQVTQSDFQQDWADTHGLTFPVVVDASYQGYAEAYYNLYMEGYVQGVPTFAVFDRELRMTDIWSGEDARRMESVIQSHLAQ